MSRWINRWHGATIGGHSLSHALWACQLPQRGSRGRWGCTIQRAARKPQRCGRFSSPLRNSKTVSFYHSSDDTPSVTPFGRASSLKEGAGNGPYHSTCRPETARLRAIFIAPTQLKSFYISPFIERHSLSHALAGAPAPSKREPGGCVPFIVPPRSRNGAGDFHRPYGSSE